MYPDGRGEEKNNRQPRPRDELRSWQTLMNKWYGYKYLVKRFDKAFLPSVPVNYLSSPPAPFIQTAACGSDSARLLSRSHVALANREEFEATLSPFASILLLLSLVLQTRARIQDDV